MKRRYVVRRIVVDPYHNGGPTFAFSLVDTIRLGFVARFENERIARRVARLLNGDAQAGAGGKDGGG